MSLAVLASLASAGAAAAQSRPMDEPRRETRDMPRDRETRNDSDRDNNRDNNEFPSKEMHSAVESNVRAAFARANFRRVQYSLDGAIRRLQFDFEHNRDMTEASLAEKQAWDAYVAARSAAMKKVSGDANYKANVALRDGIGVKIKEVHADHGCADRHGMVTVDAATMKQLVLMATVKLDYAQVATDMEIGALRGDSKVTDAREKLMAAGTKVAGLRDAFDRSVRDSKELAAIRSSIEDARIQLITAEAFQNGANAVAAEALDYTYYKNRFSNSYPADYFGYGYGGYVGGIGYGRGVYRY